VEVAGSGPERARRDIIHSHSSRSRTAGDAIATHWYYFTPSMSDGSTPRSFVASCSTTRIAI
jgi:hypothetical protein